MVYSRRTLLALLLGLAPAALADRSQAKRHAKQARKQAKRNRKLARQEVAHRNSLAKRHKRDRELLDKDAAALDKARRQDLDDLTARRRAHTERTVFDATAPEEPKPKLRPATRGVEGASEPKK